MLRQCVYTYAMSPKERFQVMLEPEQIAALRSIEDRTGAPLAVQIRRAVDAWLKMQGAKLMGKRSTTKGPR